MRIDIVKRWGVFFVLLLVQGLVCNHIHLFHCATPLLYIMFVLHFRRNTPRWQMLLWSFALGLGVDIFANTPGVAAGSMTAIALLQPYLLELFLPRDSSDDLLPGVRTLGSSYFWYSLIIVVIYCLLFFTLETFNFFNWLQWIECIVGSAALTYVLLMAIENVRK